MPSKGLILNYWEKEWAPFISSFQSLPTPVLFLSFSPTRGHLPTLNLSMALGRQSFYFHFWNVYNLVCKFCNINRSHSLLIILVASNIYKDTDSDTQRCRHPRRRTFLGPSLLPPWGLPYQSKPTAIFLTLPNPLVASPFSLITTLLFGTCMQLSWIFFFSWFSGDFPTVHITGYMIRIRNEWLC